MALTCSRCGERALAERSRFCFVCGAPLRAGQHVPAPYTPDHLVREVLTSRAAREGERKDVTVLIADVADSLQMAQQLDPETVHVVMDGLFGRALDAVHAQRGTINQFRGDGFMALFGAPRAAGNDGVRALRAALRIRESARDYAEKLHADLGVTLALRIGVHSGMVWVGAIGDAVRSDYTAEGVTVGTAARIESAAQPWQILVSEPSVRRARLFFDFQPCGPIPLRGVVDPPPLHELIGPGPYEARLDAERARGLTPFVGRGREIAAIAEAADEAAAGRCCWIEVVGEPGVGKSRLALEYRSRHEGPEQPCLEGRCREDDRGRAYAMWIDLLQRWPRAVPGHALATATAAGLGGADGSLSPGAAESRLRDAIEALSGSCPVWLLVEDIQWIDPSSERLLESIRQRPPERGMIVVSTSRERSRSAPGRTELQLGPLDPADGRALARSVLADFEGSEELSDLALQRGGGNPFFIEEVARALREGPEPLRAAARSEVEWRRERRWVPDTLRGVIAARMDSLPEDQRALIQTAAVIGHPFDDATLRAIHPSGAGALDVSRGLEALVARGLMAEVAGRYDFRHGLSRDVAYDQLLRARSCDLHRRCAEFLARDDAVTAQDASRIGDHFALAEEPRRAVEFLARAGALYLRLFAGAEALAHLERAWAMMDGNQADEERTEVGLSLAAALNLLDRSGEAGRLLDELLHGASEGQNEIQLAEACVESGWVQFTEHGQLTEGTRLLRQGLALAEARPEGLRVVASARGYLVRMYQLNAEIDQALASLDAIDEIAEKVGDPAARAFALGARAAILTDIGDAETSLSLSRRAVAMATERGHDFVLSTTVTHLARALLATGEAAEAIEAARRARSLAERVGQRGVEFQALGTHGLALLLLGRPEEAHACIERAAAVNPRWPATLDWRAQALLGVHRFGEAAETASACLDRNPPRLIRVRSVRTLALALGLPNPRAMERAEALLVDASSACDELGLRPSLAECQFALARLCERNGLRERAAYYTHAACETWDACGMKGYASRAIHAAANSDR